MQTKYCSGCDDFIPICRFSTLSNTIRGVQYKCKKCTLQTANKWKEKFGYKTYIYVISDPFTDAVVYVGKTTTYNPLTRAGQHFSQYLTGKTKIHLWNYEMVSNGHKPKFDVIDIVDMADVCYWEKFYINLFKTWGFNLLNIQYNV